MSDICISAPLLLKSFSKLTIEFSCSDIMPCAHHVHSSGYLMMRAANRQTEAKVDPRRYIVKVNIIRLRMSFVCPVPLSMPNWRPPFSPVWATLPKNSSVSDCLFGPLPFQYWTGGGGQLQLLLRDLGFEANLILQGEWGESIHAGQPLPSFGWWDPWADNKGCWT